MSGLKSTFTFNVHFWWFMWSCLNFVFYFAGLGLHLCCQVTDLVLGFSIFVIFTCVPLLSPAAGKMWCRGEKSEEKQSTPPPLHSFWQNSSIHNNTALILQLILPPYSMATYRLRLAIFWAPHSLHRFCFLILQTSPSSLGTIFLPKQFGRAANVLIWPTTEYQRANVARMSAPQEKNVLRGKRQWFSWIWKSVLRNE